MAEVEEAVVEESTKTVTEGKETPTSFDWKTEIHPEVKDAKEWESIPDLKTLTKAYVDNARYNVGAVRIPQPDAPPEEWDRFYSKVGKPSSPEGFSIPEETILDKVSLNGLRSVAHQAGLNPKQWNMLVEGYERQTLEKNKLSQEQMEQTTTELQSTWGASFDRKVGLIQRTLRQFGGEEAIDRVIQSGLGNDTQFLKMMATLSEAMAEADIIPNEVQGVMSKEEAIQQINELVSSKAYRNDQEPGHAEAVKKAERLFQLVYN